MIPPRCRFCISHPQHREDELVRRKVYRQQHPEEIREYNRQYYATRKKGRSQAPPVRAKFASGAIG